MRHTHSVQSLILRTLTIIALCAAAQPVFAQTTVISYQGKLDFGGVPANGNYDFQFRLFDAASSGAQQGPNEEQLNVTVTNGAYTVNLDFGAAPFSSSGDDRFIEVSFRATGGGIYTTLTPRQLVTTTPYSIHSLVANEAHGLDATCASCVTSGQIQNVQGSQVTGNLAGSQISGPIPVTSVPAGSASYIQNTTSPQPGSNFNISGNGTAGGTLSGNVVNATTQYNIGFARVLSVAGGSNIFAGMSAGLLNTGIDNAFFGRNAGFINTTGSNNSFLGSNTGFKNTTGQDNTFVGNHAGNSNTTASRNTFVGSLAGQANSTGSRNSFFGYAAGDNNTTGGSNSFFGDTAGGANTTGFNNTFFGYSAGSANTTGLVNSFFGFAAGEANTTGIDNSYYGNLAGNAGTTGTQNSFFGSLAGTLNTTASGNSFFGFLAGGANSTGAENSFFGRLAGMQNTTGSQNTFFGEGAGTSNTSGSHNTFIGGDADFSSANPTGAYNTLLGYFARVASGVNNSTAIGNLAQATASNTVVLGTSQETVIVPGKLEVDTLATAGSQQLCLNSFKRIAPCSSSLRYKTDMRPFAAGMSIINRLQPISFTWKDGGMRDMGFGAEDVHKIEPLLVTYNAQGLVEGVKYDRVTVVLVNALKEHQQQIASQQSQIEALKSIQAENDKLKAQLADVLARLEQIERAQANRK